MANTFSVEINEDYKEKMDILRKVFVSPEGTPLADDGKLVEGLLDTFLEFVQNQAQHEDEGEEGGHVH